MPRTSINPCELTMKLISEHELKYEVFLRDQADSYIDGLAEAALRDLSPDELGELICLASEDVSVMECVHGVDFDLSRISRPTFHNMLISIAVYIVSTMIYNQLRRDSRD